MSAPSAKQKVAISHPHMGRGGSEADCLWAIEALKDDYEVTLITTGRVDWDALNAYYGTSIRPGEVALSRPCIAALLRDWPAAALRGALHQRYCRTQAGRFDVVIGAFNPCDFGRPAIHRIADFGWDGEIRDKYDAAPPEAKRLIHRDNLLRKAYLGVSKALRDPSGRSVFAGEDIIIANSQWTAATMREKYRCAQVEVVYPPVQGEFPAVPWERREAGFVCLGRVSHEKWVEDLIGILSRVRSLGHNVHLHIIGGRDHTPYGDMIERLCMENAGWATMEGQKAGAEKEKSLTCHRYGIHACRREAFGIAVAEMVKAGCVTFVPADGGPPEIVGDARLCYRDADDAVRKIDAVLRSDTLQAELHEGMLSRGRLFGVEAYQAGIRRLVEVMLEQNATKGTRA